MYHRTSPDDDDDAPVHSNSPSSSLSTPSKTAPHVMLPLGGPLGGPLGSPAHSQNEPGFIEQVAFSCGKLLRLIDDAISVRTRPFVIRYPALVRVLKASSWLAIAGAVYVIFISITSAGKQHTRFNFENEVAAHQAGSGWFGLGGGGLPPTTWDKRPMFNLNLDELAIAVNTVVTDPGRPIRNWESVYRVWSEGEDIPHVYWYSSEEVVQGTHHTAGGPAVGGQPPVYHGPTIHKVSAQQWQERWVAMLDPLYQAAPDSVKWYLLSDDDTFIFIENLLTTLSKYDPDEPWYLGNTSEDLDIASVLPPHGLTRMGMGGGGVALSRALVRHLVGGDHPHNLAACLSRYSDVFGGDKKLSLCVSDVGGTFTLEPGFHQIDLKGDHSGFIEHVVGRSPVISLHHMYVSDPPYYKSEAAVSSPVHGGLRSLSRLMRSYRTFEPSLFLALLFGYDAREKITLAINIGLSIRVYPRVIPASFFTKYTPATAYSWSIDTPPALDDPVRLQGVAYDAVQPLDPCSYGTWEWVAPLDGDDDGGVYVRLLPSLQGCESPHTSAWPHVHLIRAKYLECTGDAGAFTVGDGTSERSADGDQGGGSWVAGAGAGGLPGGIEVAGVRDASPSEVEVIARAPGSLLSQKQGKSSTPKVAEVNIRACRSRRPILYDYPAGWDEEERETGGDKN